MFDAAGIEDEPLHTSLAGVDRSVTSLWVEGGAKDFASLREFVALERLRVYKLPLRHVPVLASCNLPALRVLSVRHAASEDLEFLSGFETLEILTVLQSPKVTRFDGIERLTRLTTLALSDLGAIQSLEPLAALTGLRSLILTGGVWTTQGLPSLAPLRSLALLEELNLRSAKVIDEDLSPICDLPNLTDLDLSPRYFEPAEIARVAAAHPFWLRELLDLPDFDQWAGSPGCKKCGTNRKVLFLRRKKLLWCPNCEGKKLDALLAEFEWLVEEMRR